MLDGYAGWKRTHPHRRTAVPQDQERPALGKAHRSARVAAQPRDGDAPATVRILGGPKQDDAAAQTLNDQELTALHADRVIGQVVAKVADADANRHPGRLGLACAGVNRIVYDWCLSRVVTA